MAAPAVPRRPVKPKRRKVDHRVSGARIVSAARSWLGVPYLYGGTSRRGVDCSGLVLEVSLEVGITGCPRTSEEQWTWCEHISAHEAGAGDLVFFVGAEIDPPPGHVGILVAPNVMIDAPTTGMTVSQTSFSDGPGINRIIGYGRMRGAKYSNTANQNYSGNAAGNSGAAGANVAVTSVGHLIAYMGVIILIVVGLALLLAAGLLFKGGM